MPRFRLAAAATTLGVLALLTACAPQPEPEPTPTGFASEDEAFAAAKETYEAYVAALNSAEIQDPESLEAMYRLLTNEALADARTEFSNMTASEWTKSGNAVINLLQPASPFSSTHISTDVCLDVSNVSVTNEAGDSVVDPQRSNVQAMRINYVLSDSPELPLSISEIEGRNGEPACD